MVFGKPERRKCLQGGSHRGVLCGHSPRGALGCRKDLHEARATILTPRAGGQEHRGRLPPALLRPPAAPGGQQGSEGALVIQARRATTAKTKASQTAQLAQESFYAASQHSVLRGWPRSTPQQGVRAGLTRVCREDHAAALSPRDPRPSRAGTCW